MPAIVGTPFAVFIWLTVVIMGGAGYLTGQAFAASWRPAWRVLLACLLLGAVDRFLNFALFGGDLLSVAGYVADTAVIATAGLIAYRLTLVAKMVSQYPWLYERAGLWRYRERPAAGREADRRDAA